MERLAVIPARAGSKGLPDKNILNLCGKPLLAYTIKAAVQSGLFRAVIVSTDSPHYGDIAKQYGARVLYRGERLSSDTATSFMVVEDVLNRTEGGFDYFALLQPTSPLRTARHIQEAAAAFENSMDRFDFLVSVTEASHPKILVNPLDEDGSLRYFDADFSAYRRQAQRDYTPNGAIYLGKPGAYLTQKHFFGSRSLGYPMEQAESVDIDSRLDFELARLCLERGFAGTAEGR